MRNLLVVGALVALAFSAYTNSHWSWLVAVMGIAASFYYSRSARLTTRVQLIFVGALGGGLAAEIVRTIFSVASGEGVENTGDIYRQVMIFSLGSVIIVLAAMIIDHLLDKFLVRLK